MSKQKKLTNTYFNKRSSLWAESVYKLDNRFDRFPTSLTRDDIIINSLQSLKNVKKVIDFGCGSGEMVSTLYKRGYDVSGFDLAEEMISFSKKLLKKDGANVSDSMLWVDDVEKFKGDQTFDVAISTGVIEYLEEDSSILHSMSSSLKKGGVAYVACRNRLFSSGSSNSFSLDELKSGTLEGLIEETMSEGAVKSEYRKEFEDVINNMKELFLNSTADLMAPSSEEDVLSFPDELIRRFHSPSEINKFANDAGMTLEKVEYFHFHPLPSQYEKLFPRFYNALALAYQPLGSTPIGSQMASGFVAILRKK